MVASSGAFGFSEGWGLYYEDLSDKRPSELAALTRSWREVNGYWGNVRAV